ncbi:unnamed protein product [Polarella glacialis]|uniref:Inosine/uridine-preferring nucleoside hydrolase domain-containing protein n=1 Tax=Polarella glacialis TaxID=89957 RepID=A0A813EN20_POLGL|nr:unnamed protein product [Polarella glacialis]
MIIIFYLIAFLPLVSVNAVATSTVTERFRPAESLLQTRAAKCARRTKCEQKPYSLIFDNNANYYDMLALLYLAGNPDFDLKAITVEADGMGTPSTGPPNMAAVAALVGKGDVPVAFGHIESLSPITTMPLQWRIEVDTFIEKMYPGGPNGTILEMSPDHLSAMSAPELILKVLRESQCPVLVLTTGPVTNLAVSLDADPSAAANIKAV